MYLRISKYLSVLGLNPTIIKTLISACNKTYTGEVGEWFSLSVPRPRGNLSNLSSSIQCAFLIFVDFLNLGDMLPFTCYLTITASPENR